VFPLFTIIPAASTGSIFNAYARIRVPSFVTFGTAVLNIVLCFLFGVAMKMELFGIGLAAAVCTVSSSLIFFPMYTCRMLGVPGSRYYVGSIVKPLLLSAVFIGGGFYAFKAFHPAVKLGLPLAGIFTALHLVYYGAAYLLLLGEGEKKHVDDALKMAWDAVKRTPVRDDV
jgi:peptidoglycan biosynthesis protein MviN/MurJ (putative lipid II flippase)